MPQNRNTTFGTMTGGANGNQRTIPGASGRVDANQFVQPNSQLGYGSFNGQGQTGIDPAFVSQGVQGFQQSQQPPQQSSRTPVYNYQQFKQDLYRTMAEMGPDMVRRPQENPQSRYQNFFSAPGQNALNQGVDMTPYRAAASMARGGYGTPNAAQYGRQGVNPMGGTIGGMVQPPIMPGQPPQQGQWYRNSQPVQNVPPQFAGTRSTL